MMRRHLHRRAYAPGVAAGRLARLAATGCERAGLRGLALISRSAAEHSEHDAEVARWVAEESGRASVLFAEILEDGVIDRGERAAMMARLEEICRAARTGETTAEEATTNA